MKRFKPCAMILLAPLAITFLMALSGCAVGYGGPGPEWGGPAIFVGGGGYDHNAFRGGGGRRPAAIGSARGRASMGARAGGGGHGGGGGRK